MVVFVVIGAFVAIGYVWKASPAASVVTDNHGQRQPSAGSFTPPDQGGPPGAGPDQRDTPDGGFSVSNVGDLVQTLSIQGAVLAGVVVVDGVRRRRRRVNLPG